MNSRQSRRTFLGATAAGGMAATAAAAPLQRKRPTVELMQVGVIAVGEFSHMYSKFAIWAPSINPTEPDKWPMRTSRMIISHCWDSRPEIAQEFAARYRCETVKNYYDMVDKVDAMIFAGLYECKWWPQLTKPYLEAGIPCFINRPFALSMKDAHEMLERSKKHNAPILTIDAHEDLEEVIVASQRVASMVESGQPILGADATTIAWEYPGHGVHGLYMVLPVFGLDVEKVSLLASGWWNVKTPTSQTKMDWGVLTLQYRGIQTARGGKQTSPFLTTVQFLSAGCGSRGTLRVYYRGGWQAFDQMDISGADQVVEARYHLQAKTVFNMQRMFETRRMPQTHEHIARKTRIFLTGFKSCLDHHGSMTPVEELPEDWEAPSPYPNWIDEAIFR